MSENGKGFVIMEKGLMEIQDFRRDPVLFQMYYFLKCLANQNRENPHACRVGRRQLADTCDVTDSKAYRLLKKLEALKMVELKTDNLYTLVTIVYDKQRTTTVQNVDRSVEQLIEQLIEQPESMNGNTISQNANRKSNNQSNTNKYLLNNYNNCAGACVESSITQREGQASFGAVDDHKTQNGTEIDPQWKLEELELEYALSKGMTAETAQHEFDKFKIRHLRSKTRSENWNLEWQHWCLCWVSFGKPQVTEGSSKKQGKGKTPEQKNIATAKACFRKFYEGPYAQNCGYSNGDACGFCKCTHLDDYDALLKTHGME